MEITFNQQPKHIQDHSSLQQLIDQLLGPSQSGIAIAVNDQLIPKKDWGLQLLQDKDDVIVIKATQGG